MIEVVVASTPDAPWLPPGGRADVVRSAAVPAPAALVRLLVRRRGLVLCTPRDDGRLDLPTRTVDPSDPTGQVTAAALARSVLGDDVRSLHPLGFVRNVVEAPTPDYPWPAPIAHFAVWTATGTPVVDGEWLDATAPDSVLRPRHWWPLLTA